MAAADWYTYRQAIGDRTALFGLVAQRWVVEKVLYLGSYVDIAPSMVWQDVTYVDQDRRAEKFFSNQKLVTTQLNNRRYGPAAPRLQFFRCDFSDQLPLEPQSFDLVISLYSGPSVPHALKYLRPGGLLMVNNSHADSSIAISEPSLTPVACIVRRGEGHTLIDSHVDDYFAFKQKDSDVVKARIASGRGAALAKPSFCHLFVHNLV